MIRLAPGVGLSCMRASSVLGQRSRTASTSTWNRIGAITAARRLVHVEARLDKLGITLPKAIVPPQGSYMVGCQVGNLLYISGHIPMTPEGKLLTGTVGDDLSAEEGAAAARLIALNMMATLKYLLGNLDRVKSVVKLNGYVQCVDGFTGQPQVVNGASDLFAEVFGEKGIHARSAVGLSSLPLDMPVELEAIVEVES